MPGCHYDGGMTVAERSGVVIIGSVSADLTTFSRRLLAPGETVLGEDFTLLLGGKGANQAISAALAGSHASFVGCVGDDLFRDMIVTGLGDAGVDLAHLRTVPGPSGIAHIRVDASAQNDIVVVPMANTQLSTEQIDDALAALAPAASVLLTQLETPIALTRHITARGREYGMTVVLDPAPAAPLSADVWASVDVVTPNETEASLLTGIEVNDTVTAERAGQRLLDQGVGAAIITLAERGSVVVTAEGTTFIDPFPVTAADTTAAGDAYAGYLGAALASGLDLVASARLASAAGALAVTRQGASPSLPRRDEVDRLLASGG